MKAQFFRAFGYRCSSPFLRTGHRAGDQHAGMVHNPVKSKFTSFVYYLLVFSLIVPFQMVMFTMSKMANCSPGQSGGHHRAVHRVRVRHVQLHVQRIHQSIRWPWRKPP
jgi:hypothetical protein